MWWNPLTWFVPIRWRVLTEREWTAGDIQLLRARRAVLAERGPHGHPMSEAMSPLSAPSNPARMWEYVVEGPYPDHAAQALRARQDAQAKAFPDEDPATLNWRVVRRDRPPPVST